MNTKSKNEIREGFKNWKSVLEDLEESATKTYMPLLADSLALASKILETYRQAFLSLENKKEK